MRNCFKQLYLQHFIYSHRPAQNWMFFLNWTLRLRYILYEITALCCHIKIAVCQNSRAFDVGRVFNSWAGIDCVMNVKGFINSHLSLNVKQFQIVSKSKVTPNGIKTKSPGFMLPAVSETVNPVSVLLYQVLSDSFLKTCKDPDTALNNRVGTSRTF